MNLLIREKEGERVIWNMSMLTCAWWEQVLGYGWAGILRKYVVDPAHMWWPSSVVQVSLFRSILGLYDVV